MIMDCVEEQVLIYPDSYGIYFLDDNFKSVKISENP